MVKKIRVSPWLVPKEITKEILFWIKFFLWKYSLSRGLFLAWILIFIKATETYIPEPWKIEFLVSNWYMVPIPEDQIEFIILFEPHKLGDSLAKFYKQFDWALHFIDIWIIHLMVPITYLYNPNKYFNIPKYSFKLKFEILSILWSLGWLLLDLTKGDANLNFFFNLKNFKYYATPIFTYLFETYSNPNKPLKWIKGDWFLTKKIGLAKILAQSLLLKQLFFEYKNIKYVFNLKEYQLLKLASINPEDTWYFWPIWWLFFLNQSKSDGWILTPIVKKEILDEKAQNLKLKKDLIEQQLDLIWGLIVEQFITWWHTYIVLGNQGYLLYTEKITKKNAPKPFKFKKRELKLKKSKKISFYDQISFMIGKSSLKQRYHLPTYYYGLSTYFVPLDFLSLIKEATSYKTLIWNDLFWKLSLHNNNTYLTEYYLIHNCWLYLKKKKIKIICENLNDTWYDKFKKLISKLKIKLISEFTNQDFWIYSIIEPSELVFFNDNLKIFPIPIFLLQFFDLINWITFTQDDFEFFCLEPFLDIILQNMEDSHYVYFFINIYKPPTIEIWSIHRFLPWIRELIFSQLALNPNRDYLLYCNNEENVNFLTKEQYESKNIDFLDSSSNMPVIDYKKFLIEKQQKNKHIATITYKKKKPIIYFFDFFHFFFKIFIKKWFFFHFFFHLKINEKLSVILHRSFWWLFSFNNFLLPTKFAKKIVNLNAKPYTIKNELDFFLKKSNLIVSNVWKQEILNWMTEKSYFFEKKILSISSTFKNALNFFWLKFNLIEYYNYLFNIWCALSFLWTLIYYYFTFFSKNRSNFNSNHLFPILEHSFYSFFFLDSFKMQFWRKKKYLFILKSN